MNESNAEERNLRMMLKETVHKIHSLTKQFAMNLKVDASSMKHREFIDRSMEELYDVDGRWDLSYNT